MERVLNIPYAIDLGNGFTKRTNGKDVIIDPSVIGTVPDYWNGDNSYDILKFNDSLTYYAGRDAINSDVKPFPALGDEDTGRYESAEFKQLLFGYIGKDFKDNVTIPLLVTGLPVAHFKGKAQYLTEMIKGKKVIEVNGKEVIVDISKVIVLPQPIGTYMYLVANGSINSNDESTLIIDGGYGSLDVTELRGKSIVKRAGDEIGVKNAYVDIYNYLVDYFGNMKNLSIVKMPYIMRHGLNVDGQTVDIAEVPEVKRILKAHFDEVFTFIRDNRFDLKSYDNVVWTGGMAPLHKELIESKGRNNFIVIDNAQEANCLGYFEYGKALLEKEREKAEAGK